MRGARRSRRWQILKANADPRRRGKRPFVVNVYDVTEHISRAHPTRDGRRRANCCRRRRLLAERSPMSRNPAPESADWCRPSTLREEGEIVRLGFVGPDEESTAVSAAARSRVQLRSPAGPAGIPRVLRTASGAVTRRHPDLGPGLRCSPTRQARSSSASTNGFRSVMDLPELNANGRTLGVITAADRGTSVRRLRLHPTRARAAASPTAVAIAILHLLFSPRSLSPLY